MNTLLLLALVAGASTGPISQSQRCATSCKESSKFGYQAGQTYEYVYEADTLTTLTGASREHSSLHIKATANIEVLSKCEHILTLKEVLLEDSDPQNLDRRQPAVNHDEFRSALEKKSLRFAFQDGRVDQICSDLTEPGWVLNVKRGVLSTFQSSMDNLQKDHEVSETDVAGKCQAEYKISSSGYNSVTIKKSKNLLGCTDRQGAKSTLQATPYRISSDVQSLPLLKSTHTCDQQVKPGGHLISTVCEENHVFRPFSNDKSGASTNTKQKLTFIRKHEYTTNHGATFHEKKSMLFEHDKDEESLASDISKAEGHLTALCQTEDIRPDTPSRFSQLVYTLRKLDSTALMTLNRKNMCDQAKKFFQDAIPMVGTSGSVAFMKSLMSKVDSEQFSSWMTSLAFIQNPDKEMILQAKALLDYKHQEKVMLPVSALVNTYCRLNTDCDKDSNVQEIVRLLRENLGISCRTTTAPEKRKMMMSMKALGNIPAANVAADVMHKCYTDYKNTIDVRVAAIDAMRRMPCTVERKEMMEILTDTDQDSELRIVAYIGLMKCPTKLIIRQVKNMMENEEVNQVGSYIWTHMTNMMETGDIFKHDIAAILKDEKLSKEFDMDKRKFSRNYEKSVFLHSFNTGAKAEGNMIWSQKSFIPRSANLNITIDVFGHSVNLLEFGGRVEGLDRLLETLVGPDGYFKKGTQKREKRSVSSNNQLERLHKQYAQKPEDDLHGSAYMRMFGNDLSYMDFKDMKTKKGQEFNILEFLIKLAQEHKIDMSRSYMFLDSTVTVPTAAGLPLKLAVNGTATVRMQIEGKMDLRKLGTTPRSVDIDGSIKPSGAVEISSIMSVDAYHARTGLKMVTSMHSSSGVDGKIKIQDSQIITTQLNWPKEKIEIFNVESKFFLIHREKDLEQPLISENVIDKKLCTGNGLKKAVGLQLCGEVKLATGQSGAPYFPLTGPASASITLLKTDSHTHYEFDARMLSKKETKQGQKYKSYQAKVAFNTPGSKVDRELLTEFVLNQANKNLNFEVRTPWKKVAIGGQLIFNEDTKNIKALLKLDETQEMTFVAGLNMEKSKKKIILSPALELKSPWFKPITIKSNAVVEYGKEYSASLSVNAMDWPLIVSGSAKSQGVNRYETTFMLTTNKGNGKMYGFVQGGRTGSYKSRMVLNYKLEGQDPHKVTFSGRAKALSKGLATKCTANIAVQNTQFPEANFEMDLNFGKTKRIIDSTLEIRHGPNMKDQDKKILFKQMTKQSSKDGKYMLDQNAKLMYKLYNIDVQAKANHRHSKNEIKTTALVSYAKTKDVNFLLHLTRNHKEPIRYSADAQLEYPGRELRFTEVLTQGKGNSYSHEITAQWQKKQMINVKTNYKTNGNRHDIRTDINMPRRSNWKNMVLSGNVLLDPRDFQSKLELLHGAKTYSTNINYNIANLAGKGMIDIAYPGRHIVTSLTGAKKGDAYSGRIISRWDADVDNSKKMIIDGRVNTDIDNLEGHIKVSHPARVVRAMFDQKKTDRRYSSHAEISWGPDKKLALDTDLLRKSVGRISRYDGTVRFISPFKHFEHLKLHTGHKDDGMLMESEGDVSWAPSKTVSIKTTIKRNRKWSNADISARVSTPFVNLEEMQMQTTYKLTTSGITTTLTAEMNKHKLELQGQGTASVLKFKHDVQGRVSMKYDETSTAAIEATYKKDRQSVSATGEGSLNGKTIRMEMEGVNKGTKNSRDLQGNVKITTPFDQIHLMQLTARHEDNGKQFSSTVNGKLHDKEISTTFTMNHDGNGFEFENNGNMQVTTPFGGARTIAATWKGENKDGKATANLDLEHNGEKMTVNIEGRHKGSTWGRRLQTKMLLKPMYHSTRYNSQLNLKYNRKGAETSFMFARNGIRDIDLSAVFDKEDSKNFDAKIDVKTGIDSFKDVSAQLSLKASAEPATAQAEVKWDSNKKIVVDTTWISVSGRHKVDARISTPFENFERMMLTAENIRTTDKSTSTAQVEYGTNKKIEASLIHDNSKISMELHTPCPWFRSATAAFELSGMPSDFKTSMRAVYDGKQRIFLETSLEHNSAKTIGSAHIQTPFVAVKDIKATFTNLQSEDFKSNFNIDINKEHNIQGSISMNRGPAQFKHSSTITSTFTGFKKFVTTIDHQQSSESVSTKITNEAHIAGEFTKFESTMNLDRSKKSKAMVAYTFSSSMTPDIATSMSVSADDHTYSSKLDMMYGPTKKIFLNAFINTEKQIRGQLLATSPFEILPKLTATFEHQGSLNNFKTTAEIDYSPFDGKMEGSIIFNNKEGATNAQINIETPFNGYSRATAGIRHREVKNNEFDTTILGNFFAKERVKIESQLKLESLKQLSGTVKATTTFEPVKNIKLVFNHVCSSNKLSNHVEYERNNDANVKLDIELATENDIAGKATFQSHFKGGEFIEVAFNHKGRDIKSVESHAELSYSKNDKIETDISLSLKPDIKAIIAFKSPYSQDIRAELSHTGSLKAFHCHGEYSHGGTKKVNGDLDFSLTPNDMNVNLKFDGGCKYTKDTSLTVSSKFNSNNVKNIVDMKYYHGKINSVLNIDFGNDIKLYSTLQTPYWKDIEVSYSHSGSLVNFNTNAFLNYDSSNIGKTDITFQAKPKINGKATLITSLMPDIEVTFTHEGEISDFKTSGKVMLDTDTYSADAMFKYDRSLEADIELVAPQFEKITANIKNQLMKRRMNTDVIASYGDKKFEMDSNIRFRPKIDVTVNLKTPFEQYKDNIFMLEIERDSNEFNFNSRLTQMNSVKFSTVLKAIKNPLSLEFSLISPIPHFEAIKLSLKHTGGFKDFKSEGSLSYEHGKIETSTSFSAKETITGRYQLTTPYSTVGNVDFTFNHDGDMLDFKQGASLQVKQGTFSYSGIFSKSDSIIGEFKISVPQKGSYSTEFKHQGSFSDFRNSITLKFPSQANSYTGSFSNIGRIQGNFKLVAPSFKLDNVALDFNHRGIFKNFKNAINLSTPFGKATYEGAFTNIKNLEGSFMITTPFTQVDSVQLLFKHEGTMKIFRNSMSLIGPFGTTTYEGSFTAGDRIQGKFQLRTPIKKINNMELNFDHQGSIMDFRHTMNVILPTGTVSYQGNFAKGDRIQGSFVLNTPHEKYDSFSVTFQHVGDYKKFRNGIDIAAIGHKWGYQGSFNPEPVIGDFMLSADNKDYKLKFEQSGQYGGNIQLNAESVQIVYLAGDLTVSPQISVSMNVQTIVPYLENWSVKYNQNIGYNAHSFHGEIAYKGDKGTADVLLNHWKSAKVTVNTPFTGYERFSYNGKFDGKLDEFKTEHVVNSFLGEMNFNAEFSMDPLDVSFSLNTPFEYVKTLSAAAKYNKDLSARKAHGEVTYLSKQVALDVEVKQEPKTVKIMWTSPFKNFEEIQYNGGVEGTLKEFKFTNDLSYTHGKIDVSGEFDLKPFSGKLQITTPYDGLDRMTTNFKYTWNKRAINGNVVLRIPMGKFRLNGQVNKTPMSMNMIVQSPFKSLKELKIVASADMVNNIQANLDIDRNDEKEVHLDVSLKNGPTQTVNAEFDSKYTSKAIIEGRATSARGEIDINGKITYGPKIVFDSAIIANLKNINDIIVTYKLHTAYTYLQNIQMVTEHKLDGYNVKNKIDVAYAAGKHIKYTAVYTHGEQKEGKITLNTPFEDFESMSVGFTHTGTLKSFQDSVTVNYLGTDVMKADASFTMEKQITGSLSVKNPIQDISLRFRHDGDYLNFANSASFDYGKTIEISSNMNHKGRKTRFSYSLSAPCKYAKQISGTLEVETSDTQLTRKIEFSYAPGKVITEDLTITWGDKKSGSYVVTTHFENAKRFTASYDIEGALDNFNGNAEFKLPSTQPIKTKVAFSTGSKTIVSASLTSPFAPVEDISLSLQHKGSLKNFENEIRVQFAPNKVVKAETTFSMTSGKIVLKTPFEKVGDAMFFFNHEGSMKKFNNNAELQVIGRTYKTESSFTLEPISGSLIAKSPSNEISLNFNHEGVWKRFSNNAVLNLNGKSYSVQSSFRNGNKIIGTGTVNTPSRAISVSFDHEGQLNQFNTNGEVKYGPSESIRAEFAFSNEDKISGDFKLRTPFKQVREVSAGFVHSGSLLQFNNMITVSYSPNKSIQTNTAFSHTSSGATDGSFKLVTPFEVAKRLEVTIHREGTLKKFQVSSSVAHNEKNTFSLQAEHASNGYSDIRSNIEIKSSLKTLQELSVTLQHYNDEMKKINSNVNIVFNAATVCNVVVNHVKDKAGVAGVVTMRHPANLSCEYDIKKTDNEISGKVAINKKYQVIFSNKDMGSFYNERRMVVLQTIIPSRTMMFKGELFKSATRFMKSGTFAWNAKQGQEVSYFFEMEDRSRSNQKSYSTKARFDTPLRSFETSVTHDSNSAIYTTTGKFLWDAAKDTTREVTMKNIYQKSGTVHKNELSFKTPGMTRDLILKGEMTLNHGAVVFLTKGSVDYNRNPRDILTFNVKVADESSSNSFENYSIAFGLAHIRSTMDISGKAHVSHDDKKSSTGFSVNYLSASKQTKNIQLLAEIHKIRKQINLKMTYPMKTISLTGNVGGSNGVYTAQASASMDDKTVKADAELNSKKMSVNMNAFYNPESPDDVFNMEAHYKSMTELEAVAFHISDGKRVTDAMLDMDLKNKHLLHTRIYWRPSMYYDVKYGGKSVLKEVKADMKSAWSSFTSAANQEVRSKTQLIRRAIPAIDDFTTAMAEEARKLTADLATACAAWNQMVQNNEFFLKDIKMSTDKMVQLINIQINRVSGWIIETAAAGVLITQEIYEKVTGTVSKMAYYTYLALYRTTVYVYNSYARFVSNIVYYARATVYRLQAYFLHYAKIVADKALELNQIVMEKIALWWENAKLRAQPFMDATSALYNKAVDKVTSNPHYKKVKRKVIQYKNVMVDKANAIQNKLAQIDLRKPVRDIHFAIKDRLNQAMATLKRYTLAAAKKFNTAYNTVETRVEAAIEALVEEENCKYVRTVMNEAYHKMMWAYEHYKVEETIKNAVSSGLQLGFRFVKKNVMYIAIEYLKLEKDRIIVYDPKKAELEFEVYIPMEWPHLQTLPALDMAETLKNVKGEVNKYIPKDYSLWDTYYKYKPSRNPTDWIPPFRAIASVSGNQHYMTFDGRHFEFAGLCSYVLARDMVDGDFSVISNYQGTRRNVVRKSITVVSNGKEIEINNNFRIKMDGKLVNLPIQFQNTTVVRQHNVITLINTNGLQVECDAAVERCTVEVSGWYFGKTAGLFGIYNNEPSDDFTTPEHKKVTDVAAFAHSWRVSKVCRGNENVAKIVEPIEEMRPTKICSELFRSNDSPFRACFRQVSPVSFFRMCVNDADSNDNSICKAAGLYVRHCKYEGVPLVLPKKCKRCDNMEEGESRIMNDHEMSKSADVVFVMQMSSCSKEVGSKLTGLARNIELSLKDKRMKNNRYGLVGFGGYGAYDEPHSHTVDGELLGELKDFARIDNIIYEDGTNKDDVSAIEAATKYPFKAGAAKVIVLITCGSCDGRKYDEVKNILAEQGFTFHVLRSHEFEMKTKLKTPKTSYLFGVDRNTAFTKKYRGSRLAGDEDLYAQLRTPADQCFDIATATQGSYFNLNKLTTGRKQHQKSFMHVLGVRVAQTAHPSTCTTCECVTDIIGNTRSVCRPCRSPIVPIQPTKPHVLGHRGEEPEIYYKPKPIAQPATFDLDYEESS